MTRHRPLFRKRRCLVVLIGLLVAGCAALGPGPVIPKPPSAPAKVILSTVPFYAQKKYQCGPAALAMALGWAGVETNPDHLVSTVYTPGRKGSLQSGLITSARRHGRLAVSINGMACLIREVAAGRPVIVLQNLGLGWLPRWHYAVVVGYDMDQRVVVLHTGVTAFRRVGFNTFVNTWKRSNYWGLGVMPADQMPECIHEATLLKAALGLQLAGHGKAAIKAFGNATVRWPHSAHSNIALGNALYRQGDIRQAVQSFYQAVRIEPRNGDALNNLAHLLAESGELDKAEDMALRAVAAGGPHKQVYLQTIEEIRLKRR
jgi:hypothetical protein